jgi:serpin B
LPTVAPSPTQTSQPTYGPDPTLAPNAPFKPRSGTLEVAMGKAGPLAPAADGGAAAATEINDFGFDLLRRLDQQGNLCVSPASIAFALAMARAGARGQTATEMDKVLRSFGSDAQGAEIVALLKALAADNYMQHGYDENGNEVAVQKARLDLANAAFAQRDMTFEQAYLNALSSRFASGMYLVDYRSDPDAARKVINDWVYDHTQGRIPQILGPGDIDTTTRLALANAMYMQAHWQVPFSDSATAPAQFTRSDGSKVSVPTMSGESVDWSYASGTGWRAVDLPYEGNTMSMTIIVPDNIGSFVSGLNAASLKALWKSERAYDVTLTLPRFHAGSHFNLSDYLSAMGMPTAFDPYAADFSGIAPITPSSPPLYIQRVIHQANIDVDEEGTTAAAATVVYMGAGAAPPEPLPSVTLHVDRPFVFLIHDNATGAVLFAGRIDDPSATS